jgi:hypothetical protein
MDGEAVSLRLDTCLSEGSMAARPRRAPMCGSLGACDGFGRCGAQFERSSTWPRQTHRHAYQAEQPKDGIESHVRSCATLELGHQPGTDTATPREFFLAEIAVPSRLSQECTCLTRKHHHPHSFAECEG